MNSVFNGFANSFRAKPDSNKIELEYYMFPSVKFIIGVQLTPRQIEKNPLYDINNLKKLLMEMERYDNETLRAKVKGFALPTGPFRWQAPLFITKEEYLGYDCSYMLPTEFNGELMTIIQKSVPTMNGGRQMDLNITDEVIYAFNIFYWARALRFKMLSMMYGYKEVLRDLHKYMVYLNAPILVQEVVLVETLIRNYVNNWNINEENWIRYITSNPLYRGEYIKYCANPDQYRLDVLADLFNK